MLSAYLNYPTACITLHRDSCCGFIQSHEVPRQRIVLINTSNISAQLQKFEDGEYPFRAQSGWNDIWLKVDFDDLDFEVAVLGHLRLLLGKRYKPFADAQIRTHC